MEQPSLARRSISPTRVVLVTLGLATAGALLGGIAGAVALAITLAAHAEWSLVSDPSVLLFGGVVGVVLGGGLAPLTSWFFLRRVPLGRAMLQTTLGTALGGTVGGAITLDNLLVPILGGVGGFLIAAGHLYFRPAGGRPRPPEAAV